MIKLGIIGTSWIAKQFAEAAIETGEYSVDAVFSRKEESGKKFLENLSDSSSVYTDIQEFMQSGISAVYIASPNGLHFSQVMMALENNLNVIAEKPVVVNIDQFEEVQNYLTDHPDLRVIEAARHLQDPNFKIIENAIAKLPEIDGANLVYAKYSSKYDDYLNPDTPVPNVFTTEFSAGALYDLGIYPVYAAVAWFGYPVSASYQPQLLSSGADGSGQIVLDYADFQVNIYVSKTQNSYNYSEIYGLKDTIRIDVISEMDDVEIRDAKGVATKINVKRQENPLFDEAKSFAQIINNPDDEEQNEKYKQLTDISRQVNRLLFQLRQSAKIVFPDD